MADIKSIIKQEFVKSASDPVYFMKKYCWIQHPTRGRTQFNLYPFQEKVLGLLNKHDKSVILKSRQLGISTLSAGIALHMMLFQKDKNILVIATKQETAKNLVTKVRFMYDQLPSWLKLPTMENNRLSLRLKNGSQIKAVSAAGDAGRSEAISLLVIDEGAFIEENRIEEIWGSAQQTLATGGRAIILSTPNGKKLEKALEGLDFMVSIDIYLNETSKYANIILPSTNGLETLHYDLVFHQLAIRNTAKLSEVLFEKDDNQKHDWQILNELTERITGKKNSLTPEKMLDSMFQFSSYKDANLSVKKLRDNPSGIDLGALQPHLTKRIFTTDKKINISPKFFIDDLKRLNQELFNVVDEDKINFPFALIGRRHLRNNNSWMHNSELLMKGKNRCTVLMSSKDAKNLSITNHQQIRIISNVGSIELPVEISDEMKEGVLSIPHGFGHNREGTKIKLAEENAGESINDLTDDHKIDRLTGNANFSGTRVKVRL